MINLCLCCDVNVFQGLHVTLRSLLEHTEEKLKIFLITENIKQEHLDHLDSTLKEFKHQYELVVKLIEIASFKGLRGIQGNHFTYARLLIPELIKEKRVLYLDSDLVVKADVSSIYNINLGDNILGARLIPSWKGTIDDQLFSELEVDTSRPYFNAGVLLLDLNKWRANLDDKSIIKFANKYASRLLAADQTILNVFFSNAVTDIGRTSNIEIYPSKAKLTSFENGIYHFVGAPKPWELFSRMTIPNHSLWFSYYKKTHLYKHKISYLSWTIRIKRFIRCLRSYYRAIRYRGQS